MPDLKMRVDTALAEVPVNLMPLLDDTDFKSRETAVAYNAAGMDLVWNFVDHNGNFTQTAVTPTTGGAYDWTHQGDGVYTIEIPASGGASINNDTEGFGWFSGVATGVLPWRGPVIQFIPDALADIEDGSASVGTAQSGDAYDLVNTRLTSTRAGYLDNLEDGRVALAVATDAGNSATTFKVNTDAGTDVRTGLLRLTSGALAGESRLVKWTGTQVTVLAHADMDAALKQFSATPADGVTSIFRPL
jgi:hypothetical protein